MQTKVTGLILPALLQNLMENKIRSQAIDAGTAQFFVLHKVKNGLSLTHQKFRIYDCNRGNLHSVLHVSANVIYLGQEVAVLSGG
jgi:hypothetical protein